VTKIRTAGLGTAVIATLLASSSAFAEATAEQRAAWMGDAFRYCSSRRLPRACGRTFSS